MLKMHDHTICGQGCLTLFCYMGASSQAVSWCLQSVTFCSVAWDFVFSVLFSRAGSSYACTCTHLLFENCSSCRCWVVRGGSHICCCKGWKLSPLTCHWIKQTANHSRLCYLKIKQKNCKLKKVQHFWVKSNITLSCILIFWQNMENVTLPLSNRMVCSIERNRFLKKSCPSVFDSKAWWYFCSKFSSEMLCHTKWMHREIWCLVDALCGVICTIHKNH